MFSPDVIPGFSVHRAGSDETIVTQVKCSFCFHMQHAHVVEST